MAKVFRPAYSQSASGTLGNVVFDKRGNARSRPKKSDKPQSAARGNVQQSFAAARKAVKIAGFTVEQAIKTHKGIKAKKKKQRKYFQPGFWATYLASEMLGVKRGSFINNRQHFNNLTPNEQLHWEKVGQAVGLEQFEVAHASEPAISPGLQLYWLANTLPTLGIYTHLAPPTADNALLWAASITEIDIKTITKAVTALKTVPSLTTPQPKQPPSTPPTTKTITSQPTIDTVKETTPLSQQDDTELNQPLAALLLNELSSTVQNNLLPPSHTPYTNNQIAQGNHLPNHLPHIFLPAEWNQNQLPPQTTTISSQPTPTHQPPQSPSPNPHPLTHNHQLSIAKQLTAYILTLLLPILIKQKTLPTSTPKNQTTTKPNPIYHNNHTPSSTITHPPSLPKIPQDKW